MATKWLHDHSSWEKIATILYTCLICMLIYDVYELRTLRNQVAVFCDIVTNESSDQIEGRPATLIALSGQLEDIATSINTIENHLQRIDIQQVTVTAYTARKQECDSDPGNTAIMVPPRLGTIAVSRDLFTNGWTFGKKVYLKGIGVFEICDLMAPRHKNRIDIFMVDLKRAKKFGKKETVAAIINYG